MPGWACGGLFGVEQGSAQVANIIGELADNAEFDAVIHGVAGGADADHGVRVFNGLLGDDGDDMGHEGLQLLAGEVVGLPMELGELFTECEVIEPAAEGSLGNAGIAGGLGNGGREGDDGQNGLLAGSEAVISISRSFPDKSGASAAGDRAEGDSGELQWAGSWLPCQFVGTLDIVLPQWLG